MKTKLLSSALFLCFAVLLPDFATAGADNPCRADAAKLCPGIPRGQELRECMMKNRDLLSPECKAYKEKKRAAHGACRADVKKFCADVQPGDGRIKNCLRLHENELSGECRAARGNH